MLTFDQKMIILESYPELERKDVSMGRVNFHYEESEHDKKIVVYHLHPNGNGFIFAGLLPGYEVDAKGFVNIRDYSEGELRALLEESIRSLSTKKPEVEVKNKKKAPDTNPEQGQTWMNPDGQKLLLKNEDDLWYLYSGANLDMAFETRAEAEEYLRDEEFTLQKND
ncbi:MAG: hypothetical protein H7X86_13155 [Gorillibacterium sp.]|nr:hypothetical protein [Gorillibacterium sp.]